MPQATAKQLFRKVLSALPDDASVEDVHYSLYVAELVSRRSAILDKAMKKGVKPALASGTIVSHEQVVRRMATWLRRK